MDVVWLDVQMWTPLRGSMHPFTDIECDVPDPVPDVPLVWERWALDHLAAVASHDGWQPGRYHYTAERRDRGGHAVEVFARGYWEWGP
ncbi:hypothetical protein [Pseudonocardia sp.]|jgi:hypothetical protein|uniref:hypothetical protein n=1 Tax=Pseudonocardia sp. TaxID=60912 RepID=UPI003D0BE04A